MPQIRVVRAASLALASVVALPPTTALGADVEKTWIGGGSGSWNLAGNWSPAGVPNNGGGNLFLVSILSGAMVTLDQSVTISALTLGAKDSLLVGSSRVLTVVGGPGYGLIDNAGMIELGVANSRLDASTDLVTLAGGGTLRLASSTSRIQRSGPIAAFLNADNTIEGEGGVGWSGAPMPITNLSLVRANGVSPLVVQPGTSLFTNAGTMQAITGSTLQLDGGTYDNTGGTIEALTGATVVLSGAANIAGGLLRTEGDGEFTVAASTPSIDDLTLDGFLRVANNRTLHAAGTIENLGEIRIDSTGNATYLRPIGGELTLTGGGTLTLGDTLNVWIYRADPSSSIRNVDNTIQGGGNLGWSGAPTAIINEHLVVANGATPLIVEPATASFTNAGTMRAAGGSTLRLNGGAYPNAGGTIEALAGSIVELNGAANIAGGLLRTEGDGEIRVTANTPRIDGLAIDGFLRVANNRTLHAAGTIENLGEIRIDSTGGGTYLRPIGGELTLTGGGTLTLGDTLNVWIYRADPSSSIRNVDNTIQGGGNLGWSGAPTAIINEHLVVANGATPLIVEPATASFTNAGTMRAAGGSTLRLNGGAYPNAGGTIEALAGSIVELNGAANIAGGLLRTEGDGEIRVTANTPRIDGLSLDGSLRVLPGRTLEATGTIVNSGEILIDGVANAAYLRPIAGEVLLTGGGTLRLADSPNTWMYRADATGFLRNGVGHTIRGGGNLGWTGAPTGLLNEGSLIADGAAVLRFAPDATIGFRNEGSLLVEGSGGAEIVSGAMNQLGSVDIAPARTLSRTSGSYVQNGGTTTVRGTLAVSGGGNQIRIQGGTLAGDGTVVGPVVNSAGDVAPGLSVGVLAVTGTYAQSADASLSIEIDGPTNTNADRLAVSGAATLGGLLRPIFAENFTPKAGMEWTVLTASAVNGAFAGVLPCERIRVVYASNQVRIEYTDVLRVGDLNCDGIVNAADLAILLGAWGTDDPLADLDGSGSIDAADLAILLGGWG